MREDADPGFGRIGGDRERAAALGRGEDFQGDLGEDPERAVAAGEQLAEVQARDVLQHAPPGAKDFASAVDRSDAQDVVAGGAPSNAAGAREVRSDDASEGLGFFGAEEGGDVGRLGDQVLAAFGER